MYFISPFFHCVRRKSPRFLQKLSFDKNLAEKSKSSDFETIFGFCSSFLVEIISTYKIFKFHFIFPLEWFQSQLVNRPETEPGTRKLKKSKCYVSNQILGEGQIWLVKLLYGLIPSINLPKTYLFMTQVMYILFLEFWVCWIQALPNSVWWIPNSWILFLISYSMSRKPIKCTHQSRNHFLVSFMHLPINSSLWITKKNNEFHR